MGEIDERSPEATAVPDVVGDLEVSARCGPPWSLERRALEEIRSLRIALAEERARSACLRDFVGDAAAKLIESPPVMLKAKLAKLTDDERQAFVAALGVCHYCGGDMPCHCMNDE